MHFGSDLTGVLHRYYGYKIPGLYSILPCIWGTINTGIITSSQYITLGMQNHYYGYNTLCIICQVIYPGYGEPLLRVWYLRTWVWGTNNKGYMTPNIKVVYPETRGRSSWTEVRYLFCSCVHRYVTYCHGVCYPCGAVSCPCLTYEQGSQ